MKRSALQCVAGFVGATLIVVGVVWTCRQLSSPTQLNAAQETRDSNHARSSLSLEKNSAPPKKFVSRSKQGEQFPKIRSTSGASKLELSPVQSVAGASSSSSQTSETPLSPASQPFDETDSIIYDDSLTQLGMLDQQPDNPDDFPFHDNSEIEPLGGESVEGSFPNILDELGDSKGETILSDASNQAPREGAHSDATRLSLQEIDQPLAQETQPKALGAVKLQPIAPQTNEEKDSNADELINPESNVVAPAETPAQTMRPIPTVAPRQTSVDNFSARNSDIVDYVRSTLSSRPTPGESALEGPQTANIVIEKVAPEEVQNAKTAVISIKVKNNGAKTARHILLHDVLPQGAQFVSADQDVTPNEQGDLFWPPFDLESQREKKFEYSVIPSEEGDFGSVATVLVPVEASCKTKCSRPELKVEATAPDTVELGENVSFEIIVSNVGSGAAYNVALLETIPEGLFHPSGSVLDNKIGTLRPGESKRLPLTLKSVAQGESINRLSVSADDCEVQEVETAVRVVAPSIELGIKGVANAYIEQSTVYKLTIKNSGDAPARNVKLVAQLPESVNFVKANNLGAYKEDEHSVYWDLAELPAQTDGEVELTVKSTKPDDVELVFSATGPNDLSVQTSKNISIDGLAALSFNVISNADLVEVGKEFEYEITIVNNGTKASSNVILQILAPDAIAILATDGPTQATNRNGVVVFDRIPEIGPKSTSVYKVKAKANQAGDCRVGFQLSSDDLEPLVKETNTRVYE